MHRTSNIKSSHIICRNFYEFTHIYANYTVGLFSFNMLNMNVTTMFLNIHFT